MPQFLSSILQIISCKMGRWLWKALQSFFRWGLGPCQSLFRCQLGHVSQACAHGGSDDRSPVWLIPFSELRQTKPAKRNRIFTWIEAKVDESKRIFSFEKALPSSFGQVTFNSVGPIGKERKEGIYSSVELFSAPSGFGAGKRCVK